MPTPRLLLAFVALLTLLGGVPAAAQTPVASPQATPAPAGFVLVATIAAEEWREPLPVMEPGVDLGGRTLLEALREGGFVLYFRHAATDTAYDQNVDLASCATQRNLSQRGRDQAAMIGEGFEALEIPVGDVRSSEFCRARETAELAFGRMTPDPNLTPFTDVGQGEDQEKFDALRALMSTPPEAGTNTVIVAHQFNVTGVAGVDLAEGEAAVFWPVG